MILDIARFAMETGGQVGLGGVSGSSKTTFLHLIGGLSALRGRIVVTGGEPTGKSEGTRDSIRAHDGHAPAFRFGDELAAAGRCRVVSSPTRPG